MKQLLLFCSLAFINLHLNAQNINADWLYKEGQTVEKLIAINPEFLAEPIGGVGMTWDYSNALFTGMDSLNEVYISPDSLLNAEFFPTANIGRTTNLSESYFEVRDEGLYQIGFAIGQQIIQLSEVGIPIGFIYDLNDPRETIYDLITINNLIGDTTVQSQILNVSELIGIGTVITPEGKYENCLLQKSTTISNGSIGSEVFNFYKDQFSNEIASYRKTAGTTEEFFLGFSFQTNIDELLGLKDENPVFDWKINSFNNEIHIHSDIEYSNLDFHLYTPSGQLLNKFNQGVTSGKNVLKLQGNIPFGHYVLLVIDKDSGKFKSFKLWHQD